MRLIDADALIEHMKNTWDMQELYLPVHFEDLVEDAPTVAEDINVPNNGWISVKDRLPEDGFVGKLIWDTDNGIRVCGKVATIRMSNGEEVFTTDSPLMDYVLMGLNGAPPDAITHITYWMPLPEPPEGVKQDE